MKIHPLLLALLVACALGGAFAIGRLSQISSAAPPSAPLPATMPTATEPAQAAPAGQVVAIGRQQAEIKTPQGNFTIEAGIETQ